MTLEPGTVVGGYIIDGVLGRGGMATVYGARHAENGRRVAVKVLAGERSGDPEFVARFQREGRLQASIQHPHVVTVFEAGESEHGLFLAMRLVPGSPLSTLMHERALDARRSLALLAQVAEALDVAHAGGLVHRDVKPQNVLVGDSDDAYLGDFGLTTVGGANGVTATGKLVGTISYLAPEVIRGEDAVPASDRYAFAAMAFECLTGTVVYPRASEAAILFAHTSEPPPRASRRRAELPQALDEVFERALAKDPAQRPRSTAALVDEISTAIERTGPVALGPPPPPGVAALDERTADPLPLIPRPSKGLVGRRTTVWAVGAVLAIAAVAAGVGASVGAEDEPDRPGVPAPLAGAEALGSDLAEPGRTVDCKGRVPRAGAPGCTIIQSALPGRALVVPEDGMIRRWAVRSASGELALAIVRPRGGESFQVSRSRNEFVGNGGVHLFDTELAVERGDLIGLVVFPGSYAGARPDVDGARTRRWIPLLPYGEKPVDRGFANELLLRVDYVRGGQQRLPDQVTGAAAAGLEPGRVVRRLRLRFASGRPVEFALVALGDRFVMDQFMNGRRTARIGVPTDFRPGEGRIITFKGLSQTSADAAGIDLEYVRTDSARILRHYYGSFPREFEFVN